MVNTNKKSLLLEMEDRLTWVPDCFCSFFQLLMELSCYVWLDDDNRVGKTQTDHMHT